MKLKTAPWLYVCLLAFGVVVPCRLAFADVISLGWESGATPTAGYKVHVGTEPGRYTQHFDVGAATSFTFTNAVADQRYCFAVTAYSDPSIDSASSNEVCGFSNKSPVLTNPGNQSSTPGQQTTLQLAATDPEGQAVTYSAIGLPPGLSLGESTGFISGSGTTAGSYLVQVTASDGVLTSSQSFTWVMSSSTTPVPTETSVTVSVQSTESAPRTRRFPWLASW